MSEIGQFRNSSMPRNRLRCWSGRCRAAMDRLLGALWPPLATLATAVEFSLPSHGSACGCAAADRTRYRAVRIRVRPQPRACRHSVCGFPLAMTGCAARPQHRSSPPSRNGDER